MFTATCLFVAARVLAVDVVGFHLGTGAKHHLVFSVALVVNGFYGEHHFLVATIVAGVWVHWLRWCCYLRNSILGVYPHVFGEVVWPHEPLPALGTFEPFFSCVCSPVTLEFIRSGKPLPTKQPIAKERPLSRMPAQMRSQMRSLAVHLVAAGYVTNVLLLAIH